jgi:hypothetical protein
MFQALTELDRVEEVQIRDADSGCRFGMQIRDPLMKHGGPLYRTHMRIVNVFQGRRAQIAERYCEEYGRRPRTRYGNRLG